MREIRFRVWDKYAKRFCDEDEAVVSFACNPNNATNQSLAFIDVHGRQLEIEQFTELKDINGKEIYEGDIVKIWQTPIYKNDQLIDYETELVGQVKYYNGTYQIVNEKESVLATLSIFGHSFDFNKIKVIGNIHES